jgi:hypothetical protein
MNAQHRRKPLATGIFILVLTGTISLTAIGRAGELRGRVVDEDTGEPLPCRLYVQASDGNWLFVKSIADGGSSLIYDVQRNAESLEKHSTITAHPFVIEVPPGKTTITAELGKEFHPTTITVQSKNEPTDFTLRLKRWINMPQRGWYSGDTHVHRKIEELGNLMLAEDLNVALPLTYWVREAYQPADRGELSGDLKPEVVTVAPQRVYWPINTEYELFTVHGKSHTQGAVFVLNHQEPLTLATPPVEPVATAAHRSGALLDLDKHSWNWSLMIVPIMNVDLFELANNHVWRTEFLFRQWTIDVLPKDWDIEVDEEGMTEWGWVDFGFKTYYALLNCGFRMRPTGGTASGVHPVPLGYGRVYVHVPGEFSYHKWIEGLNAGHSFVTTGPMLLVKFNDELPGTTFTRDAAREVHVTGSAESDAPLDRIEIIVNGDIAKTIVPRNQRSNTGGYSSAIQETIKVDHSSWIAVRCFEPYLNGRFRYAHTAPCHLDIDGPVRPKRKEVAYFIERMQQEIARNQGVLNAEDIAEYERALEVYQEISTRAKE